MIVADPTVRAVHWHEIDNRIHWFVKLIDKEMDRVVFAEGLTQDDAEATAWAEWCRPLNPILVGEK